MGNAERFVRLMQSAIEHDEHDLKEAKNPNSRITENTVQIYGESWLWPAFLKQALRDPDCPGLSWETKFVDLCFLNEAEQPVATFELKPFFRVPPKAVYFGKIVEDFEKQWKRSKNRSGIEHYAVLIPWGDPNEISRWISEKLKPKLKRDYSGLCVQDAARSGILELNSRNRAIIEVFRITSNKS